MSPATAIMARLRPKVTVRSSGVVAGLGCGVAVLLGMVADRLTAPFIGVVTVLPVVSHVRRVGLRHAVQEPSAITVIVLFYLFVFPLRGLVIVLSGYTDVAVVRGPVTSHDLVLMLTVASLGTAALVEGYYFVVSLPRSVSLPLVPSLDTMRQPVLALAGILGVIALAALAALIARYGGIRGAQTALLSHSKAAGLAGQQTGASSSAWVLFAGPAVWCAAWVALNDETGTLTRAIFGLLVAFILLAQLVVFGSRLFALLGIIGIWVVAHYSGHPIRTRRILAAIPVAILISVPIIAQRPGGNVANLSVIERYSRIASYGVLDAALAVGQDPREIRDLMTDPQRFLDLPAYLVPSALWASRPNIQTRTLDLYVAQNLGSRNQQDTGFPTTYVTEWLLYAGWPGVLIVSAIFGGLLGWLHRKVIMSPQGRSPARVLCYAFVVVEAFTYYKDGDAVVTTVGAIRLTIDLGFLMLVTGVSAGLHSRRGDSGARLRDGRDRANQASDGGERAAADGRPGGSKRVLATRREGGT